MIKFIKTKDGSNKFDTTNVIFEIENNGLVLDELVENVEDFIKAIGYCLDNRHLEIVEDAVENIIDTDCLYSVAYVDDGDHVIDERFSKDSMESLVKSIQSSKNKTLIGVFSGEHII